MNENNPSTTYIIIIQGHLKDKWTNWLNGMVVRIENREDPAIQTAITVCVPNQAALRGILNKLWGLNLTLKAVNLQNLQSEQINQGESHENEI